MRPRSSAAFGRSREPAPSSDQRVGEGDVAHLGLESGVRDAADEVVADLLGRPRWFRRSRSSVKTPTDFLPDRALATLIFLNMGVSSESQSLTGRQADIGSAGLSWNRMPEDLTFDVVVVGGGHAGIEAAWAAANALASRGRTARVGDDGPDPHRRDVLQSRDRWPRQGQIVREIDALGGVMGEIADATGIMFKMLNTSRGAAVRGPRARTTRSDIDLEAQRALGPPGGIDVHAGAVADLLTEEERGRRRIRGVTGFRREVAWCRRSRTRTRRHPETPWSTRSSFVRKRWS